MVKKLFTTVHDITYIFPHIIGYLIIAILAKYKLFDRIGNTEAELSLGLAIILGIAFFIELVVLMKHNIKSIQTEILKKYGVEKYIKSTNAGLFSISSIIFFLRYIFGYFVIAFIVRYNIFQNYGEYFVGLARLFAVLCIVVSIAKTIYDFKGGISTLKTELLNKLLRNARIKNIKG